MPNICLLCCSPCVWVSALFLFYTRIKFPKNTASFHQGDRERGLGSTGHLDILSGKVGGSRTGDHFVGVFCCGVDEGRLFVMITSVAATMRPGLIVLLMSF